MCLHSNKIKSLEVGKAVKGLEDVLVKEVL